MRPVPPRSLRSARGSVTAEFAALVPAVLLVLAFAMGAVEVVVQQARLTDAAADAARSLARGDSRELAAEHVAEAIGATALSVSHSGDYVCLTLAQSAAGPVAVTGLTVRGHGCALGDADAAPGAPGSTDGDGGAS